jgi:hypothetical protein
MSDEITRVLNNLAVDEQQLREAYEMPFLAHRQKEAREIIVTLKARNERLEKVLIQTFGEYLEEDYSDIPDGRAVGEFSAADLREVKAVLEEGRK